MLSFNVYFSFYSVGLLNCRFFFIFSLNNGRVFASVSVYRVRAPTTHNGGFFMKKNCFFLLNQLSILQYTASQALNLLFPHSPRQRIYNTHVQ
jgi:hypothetical protein